jgi:hypothetical protein
MSLGRRIRAVLLASFLGWIAGMSAGAPFQIVEAVRNAGGGSRLLAYELGVVLAMWSALTFVIALYWCGFFLFPIAWLVSAAWILRHRKLWITVAPVFGVVLMAVRLHLWTAFDHDGVSVINFFMWAVVAATFFLATATSYARLLRVVSSEPLHDAQALDSY